MKTIKANCDGGIRGGNPGGTGAIGWVAKIGDADFNYVISHAEVLPPHPDMTNNISEYMAVIDLLEFLTDENLKDHSVYISVDSMLVARHYSGEWQCRSELLRPFLANLHALSNCFPEGVEITWIPREQNQLADDQVNKAFNEQGS